MTDRALAFFELIRLQAELEVMADEFADIAEADLKDYEAAEREAKQLGLPFDAMTAEERERQWKLIKRLRDETKFR